MSSETESLRKKVATLTVINGALQKENDDLRAARDDAGGASSSRGGNDASADASAVVAQVEAECEARLREADETIDELRRELTEIAKGGDAAQSANRDKTVKLREAKNEIAALRRRVSELEGNERRLNSQLRDAEADATRAAKAAENNSRTADGIREELGASQADANREIQSLRRRLNEREQTAEKTIANLRETLENERSDATAKEAKRARSQVASAETRAAIAEAESAKLSRELATARETAQSREESLRQELRAAEDTARTLEATLSEQRHAGGFAREVAGAVATVTRELERERTSRRLAEDEHADRVRERDATIARLGDDIARLRDELRDARSAVSRAEAARDERREAADEFDRRRSEAESARTVAEARAAEAVAVVTARAEKAERERVASGEKCAVLSAELVALEETLARAELEAIRARRDADDAKKELEERIRTKTGADDEGTPSAPPRHPAIAPRVVANPDPPSERPPDAPPPPSVGGFDVAALVEANKANFANDFDVETANWLTSKEKRLIAAERRTQAALRSKLAEAEAKATALTKRVEELETRLEDAEVAGSNSGGDGGEGAKKRLKELRDALREERDAAESLSARHETLLEVLGEKEEEADRLARAVAALRGAGRESHTAFRSALERQLEDVEVAGSSPGKIAGRVFVSKDVDEPLDD